MNAIKEVFLNKELLGTFIFLGITILSFGYFFPWFVNKKFPSDQDKK